jgi:hypothetical protein
MTEDIESKKINCDMCGYYSHSEIWQVSGREFPILVCSFCKFPRGQREKRSEHAVEAWLQKHEFKYDGCPAWYSYLPDDFPHDNGDTEGLRSGSTTYGEHDPRRDVTAEHPLFNAKVMTRPSKDGKKVKMTVTVEMDNYEPDNLTPLYIFALRQVAWAMYESAPSDDDARDCLSPGQLKRLGIGARGKKK